MIKSRISSKIDARNGSQNDAKIDIWALRGWVFEIWGGFLRSPIFDEFSIGKKSAKNLQLGV